MELVGLVSAAMAYQILLTRKRALKDFYNINFVFKSGNILTLLLSTLVYEKLIELNRCDEELFF
jgi:hypothetical protein